MDHSLQENFTCTTHGTSQLPRLEWRLHHYSIFSQSQPAHSNKCLIPCLADVNGRSQLREHSSVALRHYGFASTDHIAMRFGFSSVLAEWVEVLVKTEQLKVTTACNVDMIVDKGYSYTTACQDSTCENSSWAPKRNPKLSRLSGHHLVN